MLDVMVRVALDGEAAEAANPGAGSTLFMILLLVGFFGLWYLVGIRPQRKKEKELRSQIEKMRVGDTVITIGGLCGKVANINKAEDEVTIMTSAANTLVTFKKSAVNTIISRDAKKDDKDSTDKKSKLTLKKKEAEEAEVVETAEAESTETETSEEN